MDSNKPVCKYGVSCYRKNPGHLKQFSHPGRDADTSHSMEGSKPTGLESTATGNRPKMEKRPLSSERGDTDSPHKGDELSDNKVTSTSDIESPPHKRPRHDLFPSEGQDCLSVCEQVGPSTADKSVDNVEESLESSDVRGNIKRKFLTEMPEDFYQFWEFCQAVNSSQPEAALKPSLGLQLVGPYHVLAGKLTGVPWEKCVLHYRYYYDPPEFQTVMVGENNGFHIGYFRDDPKSTKCLVVSNYAENGCEINIEGENIFSAVRSQIAENLKEKGIPPGRKKQICALDSKLSNFLSKRKLKDTHLSVKDLWKHRNKETVTSCFHKIGIVVPYDKKTELGYRPLTMTDRDLKKLLNKIADCKDDSKRDQFFEPLQEIVTFVQFANDECDYGMGLELGLDLFCHGDPYYYTLIGHLLPIAYDLLQREEYGKICLEHLKQRLLDPVDFSTHT